MENKTIEQLLGSLAALVSDARGSLFGADKCMVDREQLLSLVDALQTQLPAEIEEARNIIENANAVRNNARKDAAETRRQADKTLGEAQQRAAELVEEESVVKLALQREQEILDGAQQQRDLLINGAIQYADRIMSEAENTVKSTMDALASGMKILGDQAKEELDVSMKQLADARKALKHADKNPPEKG